MIERHWKKPLDALAMEFDFTLIFFLAISTLVEGISKGFVQKEAYVAEQSYQQPSIARACACASAYGILHKFISDGNWNCRQLVFKDELLGIRHLFVKISDVSFAGGRFQHQLNFYPSA